MRRISLSLALRLRACSCWRHAAVRARAVPAVNHSTAARPSRAPRSRRRAQPLRLDQQRQLRRPVEAGDAAYRPHPVSAEEPRQVALSSGIKLADVEQALGSTTVFVELGTSAKPTGWFSPTRRIQPTEEHAGQGEGSEQVGHDRDRLLARGRRLAGCAESVQSAAAKGKLADSSAFKTAISGVSADSLVRPTSRARDQASSLASLSSNSTVSKALKTVASENQLEWGTLAVSAVPRGLGRRHLQGQDEPGQLQPVPDR